LPHNIAKQKLKMMQKWMIAGLGLVMFATSADAQRESYKDRATAYIEKHKMYAMAEQQRSGVPAAITLGQGILETEAGNSELATQANNHFGIKCKTTWKGETFAHTDDAPNECFRKYGSAYESYKDHSDFLKQPRYSPLFRLPVADYENWAKGLKKYGYATNPRYAQQLIKIIEDFHLQDYTFAANNKDIIYPAEPAVPQPEVKKEPVLAAKPEKKDNKQAANSRQGRKTEAKPAEPAVAAVTEPAPQALQTVSEIAAKDEIPAGVEPGKIIRVNGLRAVYGLKGDVLLTYAIKYNVRYERLLEINELPDAPLKRNMYVYLDTKKTRGSKPTHQVANGETLQLVAQAEGIRLSALRELNRLEEGEEPAAGEILQLQRTASEKPRLIASAPVTMPENKKGNKAAKKSTYLEKKELEKAREEEEKKAVALKAQQEEEERKAAEIKAQQEEEARIAALRAKEEEEKAAALKAQQEEEQKAAALKAQQEDEEKKLALRTKAEKEAEEAKAKEEAERLARQNNRVVIKEGEATDEFSRLKSQLDKVVYAGEEQRVEEERKAEEKRIADAAKAAEESKYYVVKKGDTAASIAKKNKLTMRQLMEWNNMDWAEVTPGQKLIVKQ
jgi:LysM repeat protein